MINNSNNMSSFKKYLPFTILFALSIVLMLFFKYHKGEISKTLNEGKTSLLAIIKDLKPLAFETQISDEDVFNFAFYQTLPVDKEKNKVLVLSGTDQNQIYEIRHIKYNPYTENLENFKDYLSLEGVQRAQLDSILNQYKKKIYSSILVNDNNTFAINPNITDLQRTILADLMNFSENVNEAKAQELFAQKVEKIKFKEWLAQNSGSDFNDYIVFNPDTVTRTEFQWDNKNLDQQYHFDSQNDIEIPTPPKYGIKIDPIVVPPVPSKMINKNFVTSDSNWLKVVVPHTNASNYKMDDSLRLKLEEVTKKLQNLNFKWSTKNSGSSNDRKLKKSDEINIIVNPLNIVGETMNIVNESLKNLPVNGTVNDWEEFGKKMDSIGRDIEKKVKVQEAKRKQQEKIKKQLNNDVNSN